jgi:hypothetical protein
MPVIIDEVVTETAGERSAPGNRGEEPPRTSTCDPLQVLAIIQRAERLRQRLKAD